jgi:capsular polysaccharide biosynthesis protein
LRKTHWLAVFALSGIACAVAFTALRAPVYVATTRILVEPEQISGELVPTTVRLQALAQLELTLQRILSRDSLLHLAERKKIYGNEDFDDLTTHDVISDLRSRISMTHASGRDAAPIVSISFRARYSELSADVANEIAAMLLQEDVATRTKTARKTVEFFTQEVIRLEAELAAQDAEILAFRQRNSDSLPDSLAFRRTQHTTGQERLLQVERQIGNLQEIRAKAERRQQFLIATNAVDPENLQSSEEIRLARLEEDLATQSTLFSADNPRVKMLSLQVKGLRERLGSDEQNHLVHANIPKNITSYQIERAEINGDLVDLADRKKQILASLTALTTSIEATNSHAITLGNLERAQANTRLQHDQAISNKVRAETGKMIETLQQGQHITLFEKAVPPLFPQGPSRSRALAAGFAIGLFCGLIFISLKEHFGKRIRRATDISNALGIVPFATLPYQPTSVELLRRRKMTVATAVVLAVGLPALIWAVHNYTKDPVHLMGTLKPAQTLSSFSRLKG